MALELEVFRVQQMPDVVSAAGVKVVYAQHITLVGHQAIAKMGAEEAGTSGNHDRFIQGVPLM
jgi:hypothetical protein